MASIGDIVTDQDFRRFNVHKCERRRKDHRELQTLALARVVLHIHYVRVLDPE